MKKYLLCLCFIFLIACGNQTDLVKIICEQPVLPVLTKKAANPVMKTSLIRSTTSDYVLQEVHLSLQGCTDLADIESVSLYLANDRGNLATTTQIGKALSPSSKLVFKTDFSVDKDTLVFWVSMKLKEDIDLAHRVNATCIGIKTDLGKLDMSTVLPLPGLRTGVALRQHKQDDVHTSRIPGLATSKNGTLLAIYDARWETGRDLQGDVDIALSRSFDGGRTWEPMQIVLDMKEWGGLPEKYNGVSDACILVDENSGDIYVAGLWMYGVLDGETGKWVAGMTADSTRWIHQWNAKGSQPGWGVKETSQFLITKSTDDGATWSEPVNITRQTKRKEWWLYAPAPGHGITLRDGTLVFPTQGRDETGETFSNITYSKDGGKTWVTSNPAYKNTTECMAVELSDGSIMLNMRDNRNRGNLEENGRNIAVTTNLGENWTQHPTSRKALIEPTCMGSIHKHTFIRNGKEESILLFVNPAAHSVRNNITLKVSYDEGDTWSREKQILLDEYSGRGYSCITSIDENRIGIVYESSQADMVFQQIILDEINN
ncbi:exo-alpha-sialidase [Parabacteroides sp. OttesenSCG-928-G07]|nr:exo-alpha-sialidase [Parabacteroides sp. OttesenSCG-928-G07]